MTRPGESDSGRAGGSGGRRRGRRSGRGRLRRRSRRERIGKPRRAPSRRRKPAVDLEGVRPFAVRDLPPGELLGTGDFRQVEVLAVDRADPQGVAVGQDRSPGVGHDQVVDVRLLGRLHEELLELEAAPAQPDPRPGARLEGTDQGRPLLHEEARGLFLLPVDVLQGHEDEDRDEDHDRPDDQPGRDHRPEPLPAVSLAVHIPSLWFPVLSHGPYRPCSLPCGICAWILVKQLDTTSGYL